MVLEESFEMNKKLWEARTPIHLNSSFYDVAGFKQGKTSLTEIEETYLPDVFKKKILHLQCHFGQDTLSLERMGAICTGIDFSEKAIEAAHALCSELQMNSTFYCSNVYDAPALSLGEFDMVFTSYGVICWLHDLNKWATIISSSLRKGGMFYMAEFHPLLYMFDFNTQKLTYPYFNNTSGFLDEEEGTYTDGGDNLKLKSTFWMHSMDEILQSLLLAGLKLKLIKEIPYSPYNCFPNLKEMEQNRYQFGEAAWQLPHIMVVVAEKE